MPELPHPAASSPTPIRAAGCRRINLDMRVRLDQADRFAGLPRGSAKPFRFLAAFEQAEPYLGLPPHAYKLIGWLVRQTQPQDWEEGSRPIAWPAAQRQAEFLGLSLSRVKALNRALWEAGIFVIRDDPQGRRYGHRHEQTGRIIEAYGFDLSPLAQRYDEFVKIAAAAKIERNRMRKLRRRSTLARRGIAQAVEELAAQGDDSEALARLVRETAELVSAARACTRSDELALAVKALESRKSAAEDMVRRFIKAVETDPKEPENRPHNTTTTLPANDINHTVITSEKCSRAEAKPLKTPPSQEDRLFPESLNVTPALMVELAPRLASYMPAHYDDKSWPELIEAALWLSGEMGINRTLWARACQVMGREYATVALALVSTRPAGHFISGPGAYFAGMLRKFERGELCLSRTLWKLKADAWGKEKHAPARGAAKWSALNEGVR